jgi:hypothetical protein
MANVLEDSIHLKKSAMEMLTYEQGKVRLLSFCFDQLITTGCTEVVVTLDEITQIPGFKELASYTATLVCHMKETDVSFYQTYVHDMLRACLPASVDVTMIDKPKIMFVIRKF